MKLIIFLLSPLLLIGLFLTQILNNPLFSRIIREDNLIEYGQFFILLFSGLIAFLISTKLRKKRRFISKLFILMSIAFIFVAFEEISWGQRLLGIETPEYLAEVNIQDETTIHNLYFFHNLVGYGYIFITFYAAFSWLIFSFFRNTGLQLRRWVSPPWYLMSFFLPSFIYNITGHFVPIQNIWSWAEISELMLHLGLFIFLIHILEESNKLKAK